MMHLCAADGVDTVTYGMSPAAREVLQSAILMFGESAVVPTRFEVLMAALVEDMPLLLGE
jgi:hypothetical protein